VSHANARTTPAGRLLIVQRHQAGWAQAHIAAAMGISRKCVAKWIARFHDEGPAGLRDRSSRPHTSPRQTPAEVEARVLELRAQRRCGPDGLSAESGVPARTVSRILARHHIPRLAELDPITGTVIRASRRTTLRYERKEPGELVHMDVKKLGRIPDGGGWRAHGRSEEVRGRGIGYDYIHTFIDDYSRLAYCEVHTDERATTVVGFLTRALAYFATHGITRVNSLMTDNAKAYRQAQVTRDFTADHDIKHLFIRPGCPWQNGKAERLNRTLLTEWAYRQIYISNDQRTTALAPWLEHYNTVRRHSALAGLPPTSRLQPT
jgi:transposase InsO family protein